MARAFGAGWVLFVVAPNYGAFIPVLSRHHESAISA